MESVEYAVWLIKGEASHESGGGTVEFHAISSGPTDVPDVHRAWDRAKSSRDGSLYRVGSVELVNEGSLPVEGDARSRLSYCVDWLKDRLRGQGVGWETLRAEAIARGFRKTDLFEAGKRLSVIRTENGGTKWHLP